MLLPFFTSTAVVYVVKNTLWSNRVVARNSCSRILVTVVNSCALVNAGQHLFSFVTRCWMVSSFFFLLIAVGGV